MERGLGGTLGEMERKWKDDDLLSPARDILHFDKSGWRNGRVMKIVAHTEMWRLGTYQLK